MDDLISRQALLDDFGLSEKTRKWGGDHSGYNTMMLYEIQDVIESQPLVKPQEPNDFAKWVATEIFDDMWEYNKDSFAEIACRKLEKLGIVRAKGDEWELVEPTCDTCEYTTATFNPCNACKDKSEYKPQESEVKG